MSTVLKPSIARRVKIMKNIKPINRLVSAIALTGRLNSGAIGEKAFKAMPKTIVTR